MSPRCDLGRSMEASGQLKPNSVIRSITSTEQRRKRRRRRNIQVCFHTQTFTNTFLAKLLRLYYKNQKKELGENRQESEIFCHLLLNHLSNVRLRSSNRSSDCERQEADGVTTCVNFLFILLIYWIYVSMQEDFTVLK